MEYNDINENTYLVRVFANDTEPLYYVEDETYDGVQTIKLTKDPLKAKVYTIGEAYKEVYTKMSEDAKKRLRKAYVDKDNYGSSLSSKVFNEFHVFSAHTVSCYGYKVYKSEPELLKKLDLEYITKDLNAEIQVQVIIDGEEQ